MSLNHILASPFSQQALIYLALFDECVLLRRDRERLFGDAYEIAPNVRVEGLHASHEGRWTYTGLRTKAMLIADKLRLAENPRRRPLKANVAGLFTPDDINDLDLLLAFVDASLDEDTRGVPNRYEYVRALARDPDLIYKWVADISSESRIPKGALQAFIQGMVWIVRERLDDVRDLLEFSADTGFPAVSVVGDGKHIVPPAAATQTGSDEALLVTVRAFANEVLHLPWPGNVREALEIRKHKDIRALRKQLSRWSEAVQEGEATAEEQIRRSIAIASSRLRTAGRCRSVSGWTTYASVPVAAVETLLGIPPITGFTLTIAGAATQAASQGISWRDRWMIWHGSRASLSQAKPIPDK